ncbi:hypothetical protein ACEN9F_00530 [Duganella sp. CT11-25]|uniref:hypothetical protein n=1 Tax=unclassified Duganella TaxID=2636909 RepID=UPI0039AF5F92
MQAHRLVLLCTLLLCACSTLPDTDVRRRLAPAEKTLDTDGAITSLFHSVLYYPEELSLQYDGYIVGVEKSPRERITRVGDVQFKDTPEAGLSIAKARDKFNDGKLLYVTHIVQSSPAARSNCTLYNLYTILDTPQLAHGCADAAPATADTSTAFSDSWRALDKLKEALAKKVDSKKYTDLVIITMGWNTAQEEAVRNFNGIVNSMKQAAGSRRFEPLVIGVTWPSMWASAWIDPVFKGVSFPYKAHDADELGLSWLAVLLHDTVEPARGKLPIIAIGHSFGSRAVSAAACVGPIIIDSRHPPVRAPVDHVINLQGAFLSERLFGKDDDGIHYPEGCTNVHNMVLTSSVNDTAMNKPFWGLYAGDDRSYDQQCERQDRHLRCAKAAPDGAYAWDGLNPESNIIYVNANALIRENAYRTGGGAHSDIYRHEMGKLIYDLTRARATQP